LILLRTKERGTRTTAKKCANSRKPHPDWKVRIEELYTKKNRELGGSTLALGVRG